MKIVVSSNGAGLSAEASPIFGRCPAYVFVDTDTMDSRAIENPAMATSSGAGIQAAQFVVEQGARAVISGNVGPNAFDVLGAAGVGVYLFGGGTVQEAVDEFKAGRLSDTSCPTAAAHSGMGRGTGPGVGKDMSQSPPPPPASSKSAAAGEEELAELKETTSNLRAQMAKLMERLDQLEKKGA